MSTAKNSSKNYVIEVGRNSKNGQFIRPEVTKQRPDTTELEHIKIPRKK